MTHSRRHWRFFVFLSVSFRLRIISHTRYSVYNISLLYIIMGSIFTPVSSTSGKNNEFGDKTIVLKYIRPNVKYVLSKRYLPPEVVQSAFGHALTPEQLTPVKDICEYPTLGKNPPINWNLADGDYIMRADNDNVLIKLGVDLKYKNFTVVYDKDGKLKKVLLDANCLYKNILDKQIYYTQTIDVDLNKPPVLGQKIGTGGKKTRRNRRRRHSRRVVRRSRVVRRR